MLSILRREIEKFTESPEEPATLADTIHLFCTELFDELYKALFKAITSRALRYHTSQEKAMLEVVPMVLSKLISLMEEIIAVDLMKNEGEYDRATTVDFKTYLKEIESYIIVVSENINFQQIILLIQKENDLLEKVTERVKEQIGKIENTLPDENASLLDIRSFSKDIFELVMDVLNILNQSKTTTEVPHIKVKELE